MVEAAATGRERSPRGRADQGENHPGARPAGPGAGSSSHPIDLPAVVPHIAGLLRLHNLSSGGDRVGIGAVLQLGRGALARFRHATSAVAGRPPHAEPLGCRPLARAGTAARGPAAHISQRPPEEAKAGALVLPATRRRFPGPGHSRPRSGEPAESAADFMHEWADRACTTLLFLRSPYSAEKRIQPVCTPRTATQPRYGQGRPPRSTAQHSHRPS